MTNNLLDLALNFEKQATDEQFMEFFAGNGNAATYAKIMDRIGVMAMYEALSPIMRQRFATYLTNRFSRPELPDVEWRVRD